MARNLRILKHDENGVPGPIIREPVRDVAENGEREGNTCIDSDPGDLEFPDDWCWRCYVLKCVTEARAALAVRDVHEPEEDAFDPTDHAFVDGSPLGCALCGGSEEWPVHHRGVREPEPDGG